MLQGCLYKYQNTGLAAGYLLAGKCRHVRSSTQLIISPLTIFSCQQRGSLGYHHLVAQGVVHEAMEIMHPCSSRQGPEVINIHSGRGWQVPGLLLALL